MSERVDSARRGEAGGDAPAWGRQKYVVAKVSDIPPGGRAIVRARDRTYGVFNVGGRFYALLNRCPHQGAELCKGPLRSLVVADAPGRVRFDQSRWFIQCPWHGWEYDLETGRSYTDPRRSRVRSYPVDVEQGGRITEGSADGPQTTTREALVEGGARGSMVSARGEGPLTAETIEVTVEDEYVVLILPR